MTEFDSNRTEFDSNKTPAGPAMTNSDFIVFTECDVQHSVKKKKSLVVTGGHVTVTRVSNDIK